MSTSTEGGPNAVGQPIEQVLPEVMPVLAEARSGLVRFVQTQIAVNRAGRDRIVNIRGS